MNRDDLERPYVLDSGTTSTANSVWVPKHCIVCGEFACARLVAVPACEAHGAPDALERWVAGLRERLRAIEWDDETDVQQCVWCLGWKRYGHHDGCKFAALLAEVS